MPQTLVRKLKIKEAVHAEAAAWRNLVPPEPWLPLLSSNPDGFVKWVSNRLEAGARSAPAAYVNAKKSHQTVRPIAILGVAERITYRALADLTLEGTPKPDRSADDYRYFVTGPISYAYRGLGLSYRLNQNEIDYVAEADIVAFYQYVDHQILRDELELQSANVAATDFLIDFLGELQQSNFGLPQLIESSDALSE